MTQDININVPIMEIIKYKNLTAELRRDGYSYIWYCPQLDRKTRVSGNYSFDELLERGQSWLIYINDIFGGSRD